MLLYNIGIYLYILLVKIAAPFHHKAKLWVNGRKNWKKHLAQAISDTDQVVWVHAASLGEFEQGRPIIEAIREEHPQYKILLTFFSPSGYEIRKDYKGADYVCYLPADTAANAREFIRLAHPEIAIFIKYEFWLNYLTELHRSACRIFVVSAIFRKDSVFFKWYGVAFRRVLSYFERLFVQNKESETLLASIGIDKVTLAGDTRFDRVAAIASTAKRIETVERFAQGATVFVAGSTWPPDEQLIEQLVAAHPDIKFIIAPHEIQSDRIDAMIERMNCNALRYTRCDGDSPLESARVLVIDTIGILSSVYQYAHYAYIGGGFGVGIHNTLEAATFGLPIAFGPNFSKFKEARDMIALGASHSISTFSELDLWLTKLNTDAQYLNTIRCISSDYILENKGATRKIIDKIQKLC